MTLVNEIADSFPGAVSHSRLKSLAPERGFPQTKLGSGLALCQRVAKAPLNQGPNRRVISGGDFPGLFEQRIRNINGCLHMGICIMPYW
jgi:hypothetical protein